MGYNKGTEGKEINTRKRKERPMYHPIDDRFFDYVGFSQESIMTWGYRTYDDDLGTWFVSKSDAIEFCAAIGADPALAEI
jgi:hypothetical protein